MKYPVYLVDDDEAVRKALALLLKTVGIDVRPFATPEIFLGQVSRLEPGCMILDIRMPMITGLRLQEKLRDICVNWPVIIISGHGDVEACRRAFHNGAIDFLSKPIDEQDLIDAIQKGLGALDEMLRKQSEIAETAQLLARLTDREKQILEMVVGGNTSHQIAQALSLSPRTVESHRASIGHKLGTVSAAEQARIWQDGDAAA